MSTLAPIDVQLGERSHPILIGHGALEDGGSHLAPFALGGRLVIISDCDVMAAQGERLRAGLAQQGIVLDAIIVDPGEGSKDWATLARVVGELSERCIERGDHIVAFGGGVVGDLAGFAAAIFKRGCGIVQVPTSLLAMVDSAVGGKTGINLAAGKNLAGAFHQPSLILIDPACLDTLPDRHLRAGYAEIVKYGLIGDPAFFDWCEANGSALLGGDPDARLHAIRTCAAAKAAFVAEDERETRGRRALLNLGHSFAHALEAEAGYSDALLHGEAVAIGLALAFRLSAARGICAVTDAERVERCLSAAGLPIRPVQVGITVSGTRLAGRMRSDKKAEAGVLTLILARGIGQAFVDRSVTPDELAAFLDAHG